MINETEVAFSFEEVDSVKTALLEAYEIRSEDNKRPISETDVLFMVPRLFSNLNVGEGYLEDSETSFEVPIDLPGDDKGNITIIASILEH